MLLEPPDSSQTGKPSVGVALDGELYNGARLRELLGADAGVADPELVAGLYERFGPAFVGAIDGSFAVAVTDPRRGTTTLARDRHGERSLHYATGGPRPVAATRPGELIASGAVGGDLDREAVGRFLAGDDREESLLAGARVLPPGHLAVWSDGAAEPRIERYWAPPAATEGGLETEDERLEELSGLLAKVNARRWPAGQTGGVVLSGVGAALIATLVADEGGAPATLSAADLDLDALAPLVPELLARLDRPLADPSVPVVLGLGAKAAETFEVALCGVGASAFGPDRAVDSTRVAAWAGAPLPMRSPFLNFEVAEFAATMGPPAGRGGRSPLAAMLRAAGGDPVEEPGPAPVGEWLRGALAEFAAERLRSGRAAAEGLFDGEEAARTLDRHRGGADHGRDLWRRLVLDIWLTALREAR